MASCRICNMIYAEHTREKWMFFGEWICVSNIHILPRILHVGSTVFGLLLPINGLCGQMCSQNFRCEINNPFHLAHHLHFVLPAFL